MDTTKVKFPADLRQYEVLVLESDRARGSVRLRVAQDESYELGHHALTRAWIVDRLASALGVDSARTTVLDEWIDESIVHGNAVMFVRENMRISHLRFPVAPLVNYAFQEVESRLGIMPTPDWIDPVAKRPPNPVHDKKFRPTRQTGNRT